MSIISGFLTAYRTLFRRVIASIGGLLTENKSSEHIVIKIFFKTKAPKTNQWTCLQDRITKNIATTSLKNGDKQVNRQQQHARSM